VETTHLTASKSSSVEIVRKIFLCSGILSSLLYVAMNIFVAAQDTGYSSLSQTVSELSAVGAPTRSLWVSWSFLYTFLVMAFGGGIWMSANGRVVRVVSVLIFFYGALGLAWPFGPMHTREVLAVGGGTITDILHIIFSIVTVMLMLIAMGFGASAFGRSFKIYTILTIAVLCLFGVLTTLNTANMEANLPTPWMGLWERIDIGAFLLWIVVLAVLLWRQTGMGKRQINMVER
jgi:hypothetical protein